ncbi:hypothetical protein BDW75DRAFT_247322 [Aspergillus navahoensis]
MPSPSPFIVHNSGSHAVLSESLTLELLAKSEEYPFAHEADIFIPERDEIFITSNCIKDPGQSGGQRVQITQHSGTGAIGTGLTCEELAVPILTASGEVDYKRWLSRLRPRDPMGALYPTCPRGRHTQRPIRAMADWFGRPNGLCFSPDEQVVYVTDTVWIHSDGETDDTRISSIYAFDLMTRNNHLFLPNRRLFAVADSGIPDGVKCDLDGDLCSGCGDGVNVWFPGERISRLAIGGRGVANFCFNREDETYLLRVQLTGDVRGPFLGIYILRLV